MRPERGMTVAELVEKLQGVSPGHEVRLEVAEDQDVPMTLENIQQSTIMQQIIIAPVPADLRDIDRDKPRKAAPCDTPTARKHDAPEHLEVHSVVFCRECRRVFIPGKETRVDSILPCGHTVDVWMIGEMIVSNNEDSQFVDWASCKGELDDVLMALDEAGGHYDPQQCGEGRLILPKR